MTRAINPAEASPSPDDPSEFTCAHCSRTLTQRQVRGLCLGEEDVPAYLICDDCVSSLNPDSTEEEGLSDDDWVRSLNEQAVTEEEERQWLEEFEPTYDG